jgi:ribosomal protein L37AE/L43A
MKLKCTKCKNTKDDSKFYKNKKNTTHGYHSWCKDCCAERNHARYNPEQWRNYYLKSAEKIDKYRWNYYEKNKETILKRFKEKYQENKESIALMHKEWVQANPEKIKAHILVREAIIKGTLIKPDACEACGREVRLEFHHLDYEEQLKGVWLCRKCHRRVHKGHVNFHYLVKKVEQIYNSKYNIRI